MLALRARFADHMACELLLVTHMPLIYLEPVNLPNRSRQPLNRPLPFQPWPNGRTGTSAAFLQALREVESREDMGVTCPHFCPVPVSQPKGRPRGNKKTIQAVATLEKGPATSLKRRATCVFSLRATGQKRASACHTCCMGPWGFLFSLETFGAKIGASFKWTHIGGKYFDNRLDDNSIT